MARIVFADGSKQMAHNLDDQYQRWMLRREEVVEPDPEIGLEVFVPDLPENLDLVDVANLKQLLIEKKLYVQQATHELDKNRYEYGKREYKSRRAALGIAGQKIQAQQSALKLRSVGGQQNPSEYRSTRISQLKRLEQEERLSTEEQKEFAVLQFEQQEQSKQGVERKLAEAAKQGLSAQQYEDRHQSFIKDLKNQLIVLQSKLLDAYERIIELETGGD